MLLKNSLMKFTENLLDNMVGIQLLAEQMNKWYHTKNTEEDQVQSIIEMHIGHKNIFSGFASCQISG